MNGCGTLKLAACGEHTGFLAGGVTRSVFECAEPEQ
jgi:hypothetical protein